MIIYSIIFILNAVKIDMYYMYIYIFITITYKQDWLRIPQWFLNESRKVVQPEEKERL